MMAIFSNLVTGGTNAPEGNVCLKLSLIFHPIVCSMTNGVCPGPSVFAVKDVKEAFAPVYKIIPLKTEIIFNIKCDAFFNETLNILMGGERGRRQERNDHATNESSPRIAHAY